MPGYPKRPIARVRSQWLADAHDALDAAVAAADGSLPDVSNEDALRLAASSSPRRRPPAGRAAAPPESSVAVLRGLRRAEAGALACADPTKFRSASRRVSLGRMSYYQGLDT